MKPVSPEVHDAQLEHINDLGGISKALGAASCLSAKEIAQRIAALWGRIRRLEERMGRLGDNDMGRALAEEMRRTDAAREQVVDTRALIARSFGLLQSEHAEAIAGRMAGNRDWASRDDEVAQLLRELEPHYVVHEFVDGGLSPEQAQGLACIRCGESVGEMEPVAPVADIAARGQLFQHDDCPD